MQVRFCFRKQIQMESTSCSGYDGWSVFRVRLTPAHQLGERIRGKSDKGKIQWVFCSYCARRSTNAAHKDPRGVNPRRPRAFSGKAIYSLQVKAETSQ